MTSPTLVVTSRRFKIRVNLPEWFRVTSHLLTQAERARAIGVSEWTVNQAEQPGVGQLSRNFVGENFMAAVWLALPASKRRDVFVPVEVGRDERVSERRC